MWRVRTVFTGVQGSPWVNTAYFDQSTGTPGDAVTAVATFWGVVDGLIDNEVDWATQSDVETVDEDTGNVTAVTQVTPQTGTGAVSGDALPFATQALIKWRTGLYIGGREVRGRWFIPGLTETACDNGRLSSAAAATIQGAVNGYVASVGVDPVIWSRVHGVAPNIDTGTVWTEFAVLRSRRD